MTTEMMQTEPYGEGQYGEGSTDIVPVDSPIPSGSVTFQDNSDTDLSAVWQSIQEKTTAFFANISAFTRALFRNNRPLLTALGWIFLAVIGARLVLAALDAIDDIPVVTPVLELVGLVYLIRFVWEHLIWEQNRQELRQTVIRLKGEILGQ